MRRWRVRLITGLFSVLAAIVDALVRLLPAGRPGTGLLVVRLDTLGDFLLWSDGARRLARHYRAEGREVVLLANAAWSDLALALGVFDAVWPVNRRRLFFDPRYRFNQMRRVRRAGFAIALQPTFSREPWFGDAVVRASGARERIGSVGDLANQSAEQKRRTDGWYTRLVAARPEPMMELERNAEFLTGLGIAAEPAIGRLPALPAPRLTLPAGDYAVLVPGAGWHARWWPAASFALLAERLALATGWTIVLAGGPGDRPAAAAIAQCTELRFDDRVGRTDLTDLAHLLKGARLVVSNDTGAVHLAAVMGRPSVCMLGGGHFGRFLPYCDGLTPQNAVPRTLFRPMRCFDCNWVCRYPRAEGEAFACIAAIDLESVWTEVAALIA